MFEVDECINLSDDLFIIKCVSAETVLLLLYRGRSRADVHIPGPLLEEEETAGQRHRSTPGHLWPPSW